MAVQRSSSTPPATAGHGVPSSSSAPLLARPPVEVRTSSRRRKTAAAFFEGGRIVVVVPSRTSVRERDELVDGLVRRLLARRGRAVSSDAELEARAAQLADRHLGGVRPASIRWVGNQQRRWASCSTASGHIRISSRLRLVPAWVLDTVIVHELAHLLEASHSQRFHELAGRAPRLAEAEAYLAGYQLGLGLAPADPSTGGGFTDEPATVAADGAAGELGVITC